jgi:hypothetical protein
MRIRYPFLTFTLALSLIFAASAGAQGKSQGHGPKKVPPGQAKKAVTVRDGVSSARVVLEEQGYQVWRVEPMGTSQVVYYYRGNNGRGKGHGPIEKIYIRPPKDKQRLVVEGPTRSLVLAIQARLGL